MYLPLFCYRCFLLLLFSVCFSEISYAGYESRVGGGAVASLILLGHSLDIFQGRYISLPTTELEFLATDEEGGIQGRIRYVLDRASIEDTLVSPIESRQSEDDNFEEELKQFKTLSDKILRVLLSYGRSGFLTWGELRNIEINAGSSSSLSGNVDYLVHSLIVCTDGSETSKSENEGEADESKEQEE